MNSSDLIDTFVGELRIGNYVFHDDAVLRLNEKNLELAYSKQSHQVEGIRLNVNWLENFGFLYHTNKENVPVFFLKGIKLELKESSVELFFQNQPVKKIRLVHELQNLYHALTGDELTA